MQIKKLMQWGTIFGGSSPAYMGAERGRSIMGSFLRFLLSTFSFKKVSNFCKKKLSKDNHRCSWGYWLFFWVSRDDIVHLRIPFETAYEYHEILGLLETGKD